jgi:hypothetical protein
MRFTSEFGMESAWFHIAMSTRPPHPESCTARDGRRTRSSRRSVRTPRLHALLHFHLEPIHRVVFPGP